MNNKHKMKHIKRLIGNMISGNITDDRLDDVIIDGPEKGYMSYDEVRALRDELNEILEEAEALHHE